MSFEEIFKGHTTRLAMMGLFLAMLELIRDQLIWVEQPDQLGPIFVKSLTNEAPELAVQNTIRARTESEQPIFDETSHVETKEPPIPIQELPSKTQPTAIDTPTQTQNSNQV